MYSCHTVGSLVYWPVNIWQTAHHCGQTKSSGIRRGQRWRRPHPSLCHIQTRLHLYSQRAKYSTEPVATTTIILIITYYVGKRTLAKQWHGTSPLLSTHWRSLTPRSLPIQSRWCSRTCRGQEIHKIFILSIITHLSTLETFGSIGILFLTELRQMSRETNAKQCICNEWVAWCNESLWRSTATIR